MQIANPIYDVVFKYLLDDNRIAKLMISKIIDEDIETLELLPTEKRGEIERQTQVVNDDGGKPSEKKVDLERQTILVYRLDFSAKIKTKEGEYKQVIIEIQKAKFPTDIMRFRKYLGQQYSDDKNFEMIEGRKVALPVISIYFLGHNLEKTEAPVIKINRTYIDLATGKEIKEKEEFIEGLTHNSFIIQIQKLKQKRRNELEILLSIFDQDNIDDNHHVLNINEDDFPDELKVIIRRLQRAMAERKIRDNMDFEDEIVEVLDNKDRAIYKLSDMVKEDKKTIAKIGKELKEQKTIIANKDKALKDKEKTIAENEKLIEELKKKLPGKKKG